MAPAKDRGEKKVSTPDLSVCVQEKDRERERRVNEMKGGCVSAAHTESDPQSKAKVLVRLLEIWFEQRGSGVV